MKRKLSQEDKEKIVAALQSITTPVTMKELAPTYGVTQSRISQIYREVTGNAWKPYRTAETGVQIQEQKDTSPAVSDLQHCRYRAWHKQEKKMYQVWGIDWIGEKIQIKINGSAQWQSASQFIMMKRTGKRDRKRTSEYPAGQEIYAGDIVQFPINLNGKKTEVRDVVAYDREDAVFIVIALDGGEPLFLQTDECEMIGNLQENPELLGSDLQRIRALLKKYTFV